MTTLVGATEAARLLGVTKPTLYAYVSRGLVERRTAVDGRSSLYDRAAIEQLAARGRRHTPTERPTIDVQVSSAVTRLDDGGVSYRGHDVAELSRARRFEDVAELLWTGSLPDVTPTWPIDRPALTRARAVADPEGDPLRSLTLATVAIGPLDRDSRFDGPAAARRALAIAPSVLGGPMRGDVAGRLTRAWCRRPSDELESAISRSLVLLADHELATSTLAVRVACSVRTDAMASLAVGLGVVSGDFHGGASNEAAALFDEAAVTGAGPAVTARLDRGERLPGFGHTVYRNGDPRFEPLLDAVREVPDAAERLDVVDSVLAEAGRNIGVQPNIDLALGALYFVGGLQHDAPIFGFARLAGWAAHYAEEFDERPVRYRGLARMR